jgi:hypothetical protein
VAPHNQLRASSICPAFPLPNSAKTN